MSDLSPKEKAYGDLLYILHTRGIYIEGFDVKFKENEWDKFGKWYDVLSDEQQWKVLYAYRPLTRFERRH